MVGSLWILVLGPSVLALEGKRQQGKLGESPPASGDPGKGENKGKMPKEGKVREGSQLPCQAFQRQDSHRQLCSFWQTRCTKKGGSFLPKGSG